MILFKPDVTKIEIYQKQEDVSMRTERQLFFACFLFLFRVVHVPGLLEFRFNNNNIIEVIVCRFNNNIVDSIFVLNLKCGLNFYQCHEMFFKIRFKL